LWGRLPVSLLLGDFRLVASACSNVLVVNKRVVAGQILIVKEMCQCRQIELAMLISAVFLFYFVNDYL
jgi:hypothetical protein